MSLCRPKTVVSLKNVLFKQCKQNTKTWTTSRNVGKLLIVSCEKQLLKYYDFEFDLENLVITTEIKKNTIKNTKLKSGYYFLDESKIFLFFNRNATRGAGQITCISIARECFYWFQLLIFTKKNCFEKSIFVKFGPVP